MLIVHLPPGDGGAKVGLDDFLAAGHTAEDLLGLAREETPPPRAAGAPASSTGLPSIDADDLDLKRVTAHALTALQAANDPPVTFRHGGTLARLERDDHGALVVRHLDEHRLRHRLARVATWTRVTVTKRGPVVKDALPPMHVARDLLAMPEPPLPILRGLSEAPILTAAGAIHDRPGYDGASGIVYAPPVGFTVPPVPDAPRRDEIAAARALLLDEFLGDFPFITAADRAHALALLLHPFVRDLIAGATPLHSVEKSTPGTGATLLVNAATLLAVGRAPAVMAEGRDEDEWRKRVMAVLLKAAPVVVIDNLRRRLDSAALSSAITALNWEDRLLGRTEMVTVPVRCLWVVTGNNPALSAEIARRTIRIRLDARTDQPWLRSGFRHPDLLAWARERRPDLIHAALVLGRAWVAAGRPEGPGVLGMFEAWCKVMGGLLAVAEVPGFLRNIQDFYADADAEGAAIRAFVAAWWEAHRDRRVTAQELFAIATADSITLDIEAASDRGRRTKLGKLLATLRDRHYRLPDGREVRVEQTADRLHGATVSRLSPVGELGGPGGPGERGDLGELFSPVLRHARARAHAQREPGGEGSQGSPGSHAPQDEEAL